MCEESLYWLNLPTLKKGDKNDLTMMYKYFLIMYDGRMRGNECKLGKKMKDGDNINRCGFPNGCINT